MDDPFVKGKRKAIDEVAKTQAGAVHSKAKCRKYDGAYAFLLSASLTGRASHGSHRNKLYTGRDKVTVVNHFNFVSVCHN